MSVHVFGIVTEVEETARGNLQGLSILEADISRVVGLLGPTGDSSLLRLRFHL